MTGKLAPSQMVYLDDIICLHDILEWIIRDIPHVHILTYNNIQSFIPTKDTLHDHYIVIYESMVCIFQLYSFMCVFYTTSDIPMLPKDILNIHTRLDGIISIKRYQPFSNTYYHKCITSYTCTKYHDIICMIYTYFHNNNNNMTMFLLKFKHITTPYNQIEYIYNQQIYPYIHQLEEKVNTKHTIESPFNNTIATPIQSRTHNSSPLRDITNHLDSPSPFKLDKNIDIDLDLDIDIENESFFKSIFSEDEDGDDANNILSLIGK